MLSLMRLLITAVGLVVVTVGTLLLLNWTVQVNLAPHHRLWCPIRPD